MTNILITLMISFSALAIISCANPDENNYKLIENANLANVNPENVDFDSFDTCELAKYIVGEIPKDSPFAEIDLWEDHEKRAEWIKREAKLKEWTLEQQHKYFTVSQNSDRRLDLMERGIDDDTQAHIVKTCLLGRIVIEKVQSQKYR